MKRGPAHILVVDDDEDGRVALARVLTAAGHDVVQAGDALTARERLPDYTLELMISDITMPERDGVWLLREVLALQPDLPVIMLTGQTDLDTAVTCLKLGALDFLTKPVLPAELQARVASAVAQRRLELDYRRLQSRYQEDLEAEVQRLARRNTQMFLNQVQMAVGMLEAKDPYTRGHSDRVSRFAYDCAEHLGLGARMLSEVKLGGALHDIGKIGTRDAVLNKPGPLTPEEFGEIRQHTIDGERMLEVLRDDHPHVLAIVRSHHERMNGSGFPDGLSGDEIPLTARIVAVCDAYDAMTTTRTYRTEQPVQWALGELRQNAGTLFDPGVVEVFLDLHATLRWPAQLG